MTISCRINSSTVLDMNIWTLRRRSRLLRQSSAIEIRRQGSLNMTTQKRVTEKNDHIIRILRLLSSNYDDVLSDKQFHCTGQQYLDTWASISAATTVVSYRNSSSGVAKHDDSKTSDKKKRSYEFEF